MTTAAAPPAAVTMPAVRKPGRPPAEGTYSRSTAMGGDEGAGVALGALAGGRHRGSGQWPRGMAGLFGEQFLTVGNVLLRRGLVGSFQLHADAEVLPKASDCILVALVLLEASSLIKDVRGIFGVEEEVRED